MSIIPIMAIPTLNTLLDPNNDNQAEETNMEYFTKLTHKLPTQPPPNTIPIHHPKNTPSHYQPHAYDSHPKHPPPPEVEISPHSPPPHPPPLKST
mmetsp:Transcript_15617/g.24237  ORF Transcript_15617/g.24237 Transcript_15617/m.24237 type:complete len:95 (+) Transcript_15617:530-814(+)